MRTRSRNIDSLAKLVELEAEIRAEIQKHPLDRLLLGLRAMPPWEPEKNRGAPRHVIGVAARFATRYGIPGPLTTDSVALSRAILEPLLHLVADFAHADPCAWSGRKDESVLPLFLRITGNQFPYNISVSGKWARSEILFNDLPNAIRGKNGVPDFDFHSHFKAFRGVSVREFIDVGYVTYCAASAAQHLGFTRGYFEKARREGLIIPDDETVRRVLGAFAADSAEHSRLAEKFAQDPNFAAYDFNSLFVYPIIRPWPLQDGEQLDLDRMIAPIPDLVLYRMTNGIYFDMQDHFRRHAHEKQFETFFGHLLDAYVGRILSGFVPVGNLLSEAEIRRTYPTSAGKVPDWIIIDGRRAILIEVKTARIPRLVYATGDENKLRQTLEKVRDGLMQLHEFERAVRQHRAGLERLARCRECIKIILTFEPTYLGSSELYKDRLRDLLDPSMRSMQWGMLSLDDIEWLQVHLADQSIDLASAFLHSLSSSPDAVVNAAAKLSGRNYGSSMLCQVEAQLYRRLGVPSVRR